MRRNHEDPAGCRLDLDITQYRTVAADTIRIAGESTRSAAGPHSRSQQCTD